MFGKLSIVATPIGNLEDVTLRALRTLRECDVLLCEDTRVTSKLLAGHGIEGVSLRRFDAHASPRTFAEVAAFLLEGRNVALATDAGTPGISDPAGALVAYVSRELPDVVIEPIPGASALTALASVADIPTDRFVFLGFLPQKHGRTRAYERIAQSEGTVFFYESPHRIVRTLRALAPLLGERRVIVGRELTKKFETIYRGTAAFIADELDEGTVKGECVVAVAGVK